MYRDHLKTISTLTLWLGLFILPLSAGKHKTHPIPDFTKGDKPFEKNSFNVGPTGIRGWTYRQDTNTEKALQILVTEVHKKSPADGVLNVDDVILGVNGRGRAPLLFEKDARKSIALAIADAEAHNPAILKILYWRNGKKAVADIQLEHLGSYSKTAPYNCKKSKMILERGVRAFVKADNPGIWSIGLLILLAANNPENPDNHKLQAKAREWAHAMRKDSNKIIPDGRVAWSHSYIMIILAEYYLQTKDKKILSTLESYANCYARNQSWFGTTGHIYANKRPDGGDNGPMSGYGAINGSGVAGFLGLSLCKNIGITNNSIENAIKRSDIFFSSYAGKSSIPYGEHSYRSGNSNFDMNGKNATAALAFLLQQNRNKESVFFAKMTTASSRNRQKSHAGPYFNYVWPTLGAGTLGPRAVTHYFKRSSWLFDLARRWDGKMTHDQFGFSPKYRDFPAELTTLLTYALPLRQIYITGKGHEKSRFLNLSEINEIVKAEDFEPANSDKRELIELLSSWAPQVRYAVSVELGKRYSSSSEKEHIVTELSDMLTSSNSKSITRNAICMAFGELQSNKSIPLIASMLNDKDSYVRFSAARALRYLDRNAVMKQLNVILKAAAKTSQSAFPLMEGDPLQFTHHQIAMLLFYNDRGGYGPKGLLSKSIKNVNSELLWPAIRAVASTPTGQGRSTLGSVLPKLNRDSIIENADVIIPAIRIVAPGDAMFSSGIRRHGIEALLRHGITEGIPLCKDISERMIVDTTRILGGYAGSVLSVDEELDMMQFIYDKWKVDARELSSVVEKIVNDANPKALTPLKKIFSISTSDKMLSLPKNKVELRSETINYVLKNPKESIYTWDKVQGPGSVQFSKNGTWDSKNTTVSFSERKPGIYIFELKMTDALGYSSVSDRVKITLNNTDGKLPLNVAPVANSQSLTIVKSMPISIKLSGSDPDGDQISYVIEKSPKHGRLLGKVPNLQYQPAFGFVGKDNIVFKVIDGQGLHSTGTISISTKDEAVGLTLYETFDCKPGLLHGQITKNSVGFDGAWVANGSHYAVNSISLSYPSLPSTGGRMLTLKQGRRTKPAIRKISKKAMVRDQLLKNGSNLWFSVMLGVTKECNRVNGTLRLGLMNESSRNNNVGLFLKHNVIYAELNQQRGNSRMRKTRFGKILFPDDEANLLVVHCKWSEEAGGDDVIKLYRVIDIPKFGPTLIKKPVSITKGDLSQELLDSLYFHYSERFSLDEIRVGPTFRSVLIGTKALEIE